MGTKLIKLYILPPVFILLVLLLVSLSSCTHNPVGIDSLEPVCFDSVVMPLLQTSCGKAGCHDVGSNEGGFSVSGYHSVMQLVSAGDPRGSKLYQIITDINSEEMMPPGQPLSKDQRSVIEVWIAQGAEQNPCDGSVIPPDEICFVQDILPMISSNCGTQGCHDAATHREGYVLIDYNTIMNGIQPNSLNGSAIYQSVTGNEEEFMPPSPRTPLTPKQIADLREWILSGAENSDCPGAVCDTLNPIGFTAQVNPVIQQKCTGCHNSTTTSGGVNLDGYPNVHYYATTLRSGTPILKGVIRRMNGFQAMPQSYSLDICTIRTIELWMEQGAADN
jgi:hypothetical protein